MLPGQHLFFTAEEEQLRRHLHAMWSLNASGSAGMRAAFPHSCSGVQGGVLADHALVMRLQWGTKLQEDATFMPQEQLMMAKAAKYVEGLADNPKS